MRPLGTKIQLEIKEIEHMGQSTGAINEKGKVIAIGKDVWIQEIPGEFDHRNIIGKTLYFKAWAVDIITDGEQKYYFIDCDSEAICGISD